MEAPRTQVTRLPRASGRGEAEVLIQVYTVTGSGQFPWDMLRYDAAWPGDQEAATTIHRELAHSGREEYLAKRSVLLRGLIPPTTERWASFGWKVER